MGCSFTAAYTEMLNVLYVPLLLQLLMMVM
jgi:hypothetical protein